MSIRKTQSHGKIGEAAVTAKCWMHGIPAYNTRGLRHVLIHNSNIPPEYPDFSESVEETWTAGQRRSSRTSTLATVA